MSVEQEKGDEEEQRQSVSRGDDHRGVITAGKGREESEKRWNRGTGKMGAAGREEVRGHRGRQRRQAADETTVD